MEGEGRGVRSKEPTAAERSQVEVWITPKSHIYFAINQQRSYTKRSVALFCKPDAKQTILCISYLLYGPGPPHKNGNATQYAG